MMNKSFTCRAEVRNEDDEQNGMNDFWKSFHPDMFTTICKIRFLYKNQSTKQLYTVNHKKRDILFLTITLANLNRFL